MRSFLLQKGSEVRGSFRRFCIFELLFCPGLHWISFVSSLVYDYNYSGCSTAHPWALGCRSSSPQSAQMREERLHVPTTWASTLLLLWDGSKVPTNTVKRSYINHNTQELRCHSFLFGEKHKS